MSLPDAGGAGRRPAPDVIPAPPRGRDANSNSREEGGRVYASPAGKGRRKGEGKRSAGFAVHTAAARISAQGGSRRAACPWSHLAENPMRETPYVVNPHSALHGSALLVQFAPDVINVGYPHFVHEKSICAGAAGLRRALASFAAEPDIERGKQLYFSAAPAMAGRRGQCAAQHAGRRPAGLLVRRAAVGQLPRQSARLLGGDGGYLRQPDEEHGDCPKCPTSRRSSIWRPTWNPWIRRNRCRSRWTAIRRPGREVYEASCIACHGENGEGSALLGSPRLSNQHDWYLLRQIKDFCEAPAAPSATISSAPRCAIWRIAGHGKKQNDVIAYIATFPIHRAARLTPWPQADPASGLTCKVKNHPCGLLVRAGTLALALPQYSRRKGASRGLAGLSSLSGSAPARASLRACLSRERWSHGWRNRAKNGVFRERHARNEANPERKCGATAR